MPRSGLRKRTAKLDCHPPRPWPIIPMFRDFLYWRRAKRIYPEHWMMVAMVVLAFANAVRLLAF